MVLCGTLLVSQAANAFFCFRSASGNKSFGRSYPPAMPMLPHQAYRLPPIMPRSPHVRYRGPAPQRPHGQALTWRPVR